MTSSTDPMMGRDPRLDFFRGLAMLIIFIAHVPTNKWIWYIPARFGFSDATEMFVFLSGMASSIAFGGAFRRGGFAVGSARIGYRCWQIYACHLGLFFALAAMCAGFNFLFESPDYIARLNLGRFFNNTQEAIVHLVTLRYVPNYFDILPMYMVALALVPIVMLLSRVHILLAPAASVALYIAMWIFDLEFVADTTIDRPWFFNPFGWQLIFFTGFVIGMGWVKLPKPTVPLVAACVVFIILCIPVSHWPTYSKIEWLSEIRESLKPFIVKTNFGILRWVHFMALAYLIVIALRGREWILRSRIAAPFVKTGQNALPVFLMSMAMAYTAGMVLDRIGRNDLNFALVNISGLILLIALAYMFGWFKSTPWRKRPGGTPTTEKTTSKQREEYSRPWHTAETAVNTN
ncbi:MAG: OpgC domain-containing protein [Gammaproteobacteria bacterium]|nr:OpgC domain-containing protein [Gammaproteobacteria bacterium]